MPIINEEYWNMTVDVNQDPYGKCCVQVAEKLMERLDELPEDEEFDASEILHKVDLEMKAGLTGFMAGAVASIVVACHSRGEDFKNSWNKKYGIEEAEGVVNPALLTVEVDKKDV